MPGMQDDQSHAVKHAVLHPYGDLVGYFVVRAVTPPDEDVGVVEDFLRQAVFRHIEGRGADVVFFVASERFGYCAVDAAGVYFGDPAGALMDVFVPYGYVYRFHKI